MIGLNCRLRRQMLWLRCNSLDPCRFPTVALFSGTSGGFLGVEEEILGSPLERGKLEDDLGISVMHSEISWTDLGSLSQAITQSPRSRAGSRNFSITHSGRLSSGNKAKTSNSVVFFHSLVSIYRTFYLSSYGFRSSKDGVIVTLHQ